MLNVGHFLTRRARRNPTAPAVYEPAYNRRFSFAELSRRSDQVGNGLTALGLERGDRVGLLLMNGVEFTEAFFGAGKAGFANVPLNWRLVPDELEFILADAGARVLIYSGEFADAVTELRSRGDATQVEHWIQVGGGPADGAIGYDDWIAAASDAEITVDAGDDDLLFIMYTSGTTGLPKGVIHTHNTVLWSILAIAATTDFRQGDRYLNSLPLFHVGALGPVLACVYSGVSLTLMKAFDPTESWRLIEQRRSRPP